MKIFIVCGEKCTRTIYNTIQYSIRNILVRFILLYSNLQLYIGNMSIHKRTYCKHEMFDTYINVTLYSVGIRTQTLIM